MPRLLAQEGLNRSAMDPKERAKAEMRDWLTSTVDSLNTQVRAGRGWVVFCGGQDTCRVSRCQGKAA